MSPYGVHISEFLPKEHSPIFICNIQVVFFLWMGTEFLCINWWHSVLKCWGLNYAERKVTLDSDMTLQRTSSVYLWKAVAKERTALHRAAVGPNSRSLGTPRKAWEDAQYRSERQRRSWRQCGRISFRDRCKCLLHQLHLLHLSVPLLQLSANAKSASNWKCYQTKKRLQWTLAENNIQFNLYARRFLYIGPGVSLLSRERFLYI